MTQNGQVTCGLCGSARNRIVSHKDRSGAELETRLCEECGLVFNNPLPSTHDLEQFYSNDYRRSYKGADLPRKRQILRNFRRTRRDISGFIKVLGSIDTVLDVGAGSGEFLYALKLHGKTVEGLEPNRAYSNWCREHLGLDVQTLTIDAFNPGTKRYDLINLSHVLEHLPDPVTALIRIADWLAEEGVLRIEVPDIFEYAINKSRGNMFHFGHLYTHSPFTLRETAAKAGLIELGTLSGEFEDRTTAFFVKSNHHQDLNASKEIAAANAARVLDAINHHYDDEGSRSFAGLSSKISKFGRRLGESLSSMRYANAAEIGKAVIQNRVEP